MNTAEIVQYQKSDIAGMGAIVHKSGVSFRVWAPHAQEVFVVGDFNEWEQDATPLEHEENGYWSVTVPDAYTGQQYKYLLKTDAGDLYRNDPYAREMTNSVGNSIITDTEFDWEDSNDQFVMPLQNEMVIYELHVGTFNVKEEGKPGDFYGVIEKLDLLKSMGINVIEIMPIAEFPGGFSWGYNPAHPFTVESEYGGPKGLRELVKAAHKLNIAVILDVVYNHFGPTDMDLWQFDGWSENGMGGIYFYHDWRSKTPWGDTRPDYGRSEVRQYIRDNALMWLEEYRMDGLRMDMIPYMRNVNADGNPGNDLHDGYTLIQWLNSEIKQRFPYKFTVAEDLHSLHSITAPIDAGGLGYSSQWDAEYVHPIRQTLIAMNDNERDMNVVATALTHRYNNDVFERVVYTESHDEVANGKARVAQEIAGQDDVNTWYAKKRSTLGAILTMTTPGIPMLFQGQAIMEDKWFHDTDPLDWSRLEQFAGIAQMYKDIIHLRRNIHGNTRGLMGQNIEILAIDNEHKIIAFHRWLDGGVHDSTVVVMNFSCQAVHDYAIPFPIKGHWKIRFNSDWEGYDNDFDNHITYDAVAQPTEDNTAHVATLSLAAYSAVIYSQEV